MTQKRSRKQIAFFLLSLIIVTLSVILLAIIQKTDKQPADPNFQRQTLTWKKEDGSIMELTVSVPKSWKCDSPIDMLRESDIYGDIYFDDERGEKIAGSFGIIDTLQEGQTLLDLENPHNFLLGTLRTSTLSVNGTNFRLDVSCLGKRINSSDIVFVYAYCFALENQVVSFYFYNDNDNPDLIPLYEKILSSIEVTIQ